MVEELCGAAPAAARRTVAAALAAAGCPDAAYDAAELLRAVTGRDPRLDETPLCAADARRLAALARRRAAREPLQYILGSWDFMGLTLKVGPGVLCPRPDSEVVCQAAIERLAGRPAPAVLDLCAGSGCLGLGVARFVPGARVTCVEWEAAAFAYLQANTAAWPQVQAVRADVRSWHSGKPDACADLILANPPYLTAAEMADRMPEVACEPRAALDGGPDGLDFYRLLLRDYRRLLRPGGWLVLEIGAAQGAAVQALAAQNGWQSIACLPDYGGHDRVVTAQPG